jgi:hypothetical protein
MLSILCLMLSLQDGLLLFLGILTDGLSPKYVLTVLSKQAIYPLNPPDLQQEKFS